jgi:predicted transglutaminase-like cysteine proteinase
MIAEIIPGAYDFHGKKVFRPSKRRHKVFHPTFPMGLFVRAQLSKECHSIKEIRNFLRKCYYISDEEQFGRKDYWMPPNEFEEKKQGDCEDFALWTWRQLMGLGFSCRFVVGYAGKYGEGHAWLTAEKDDKRYIIEPLARSVGDKLPRLSFVRYIPEVSVSWDGKKVHYYQHKAKQWWPTPKELITLPPEWLFFYTILFLKLIVMLLLSPFFLTRRILLKIVRKLFQR